MIDVPIGARFGKLTVVKKSIMTKTSRTGQAFHSYRCECKCDCGKTVDTAAYLLRNGNKRTCGCRRREIIPIGTRFTRLVVLSYAGSKNNLATWLCKCDCGNTKQVTFSDLRRKRVQSCGCLVLRYEKGVAALTHLYNRYKREAKTRELTFGLSREYFKKLILNNCVYCGQMPLQEFPKQLRLNGTFLYNGIDRVDSDRGYEIDNCVSCCGGCNTAKMSFSETEFKQRIIKIYNHWASK